MTSLCAAFPDIRKISALFEGSQSSSASSFDKGITKVKTRCSTGEIILTRKQ